MAAVIMKLQESLASLSGVERTGPETCFVTGDRSDLLQDPTRKVTRGSTSGPCSLTENVWTYAMAMKKRLLIELLLMIDTMRRMLEMRDSYLAMIGWTEP